jgi:predicted nucleotidyltransferase component of viral defense system
MKLHKDRENFSDLIALAAEYIGIPQAAVKRDYYIVKLLQNIQNSEFSDKCVFKGGTSLSKCYPGSIERFSEDLDLTFISSGNLSNKQYNKALKHMESIIIGDAHFEIIENERNDRNKSSYVWFEDEDKITGRIKLEIGSSVRPEPFEKRGLKTYIQEYLEAKGMPDVVTEFELEEIKMLVLRIERTFVDKLFSVKRHAICGTLPDKVRHIYDVTKLYAMAEIQSFMADKALLKSIVAKTKKTDSFYLEKRNLPKDYDPIGSYDFPSWEAYFDVNIRKRYESLHEDLLYTNQCQNFAEAVSTFKRVSTLLSEIGE